MKTAESTQGVLCLVGGADPSALLAELIRIDLFIEQSVGLHLIDLVFSATVSAQSQPCKIGMWVTSLDNMKLRIRMAIRGLQAGRTRLREKSGIFYTATPLAAQGGKVAFIYPGTGSFHLEMMRDLAMTFDGVREMFDDMEEAFVNFCDMASPSEWLFATSPEHALTSGEHAQAFFPLLAVASTFLASQVFTQFLANTGVEADAVAGIGLGAFTAYRASCRDPKSSFVQLLRDAGKIMLRLMQDQKVSLVMTSVSKCPADEISEFCQQSKGKFILIERLSAEDCVICTSQKYQQLLESKILSINGQLSTEPLISPFNTGLGSQKMHQLFLQFFSRWVMYESSVPLYSCATGDVVGASTSSVVEALIDQMMAPIDLEQLINRLYDNGHRIFVEVGARGGLSPMMDKILKHKPEPCCVIPMHILHRSGAAQVGQALGILATQGVPIDVTRFRFFKHAQWLDFNKPIRRQQLTSSYVPLQTGIPAIQGHNLNPRLLMDETTTQDDLPKPTRSRISAPKFARGVDFPLLHFATVVLEEEDSLIFKTKLHLKDFPFMSDFAIGSSHISAFDTQLHGLTLLTVPTSLELMAEAARKRYPTLKVAAIKHIRAQRWLSFDYNQITLRIEVSKLTTDVRGATFVKVRLYDESPKAAFEAPLIEANYLLTVTGQEIMEANPEPALMSPRLENWQADEIYANHLPQGKRLQNIRKVVAWGMNGIDFVIQMPSRSKTISYAKSPIFSIMPLVLDALTSGFSLWRSHERFHGAISLPFRCRSIEFAQRWPEMGTQMKATLRLTNVTPRSHQVEIRLYHEDGSLLVKINGWEEISDRAEPALQHYVKDPVHHYITQPLPKEIFADEDACIMGATYECLTPDFFEHNQELWLKALSNAALAESENTDFQERTGSAHRRLEWLLGRIAAKESVRRYLEDNHITAASADVTIWKDDLGKPHPIGEWVKPLGQTLDLTIAHTTTFIVAAVAPKGHLGLDVERVDRDLTEEFLQGVFTIEEQEIASKSGHGPTAVLRFWCCKEAVSKALGTGIRFAPTDLRIREADAATGIVKMELLGQWCQHFPQYKGQLLTIKTSIMADHAVAACYLPH